MDTTHYESAEGIVISKARAMRELARHGLTDVADTAAFLAELGNRQTYRARDVLAWLGY